MPRNRAERRHHEKRIRDRVRGVLKDIWQMQKWLKEPDEFEVIVCKRAAARQPCSCYMCGNPRKWNREKTWQEQKQDIYDGADKE